MHLPAFVDTRACGFILLACALSTSQTIPHQVNRPAAYASAATIDGDMLGREDIASGTGTQFIAKDLQQKMILTSKFSDTDITPDGDLDKNIWTTANKVRFNQDAFHKTEYPELETTVASLWTKEYLYLAYWCKYRTLNTFKGEDPRVERWELWNRDVVEAFIAPQAAKSMHYYEFEVAPNNQWLDLEINLESKQPHNALWNSGFIHATRVDPARRMWTVEMRIPVRSMGVQHIDRNTNWRINLYRADGAGSDEQRRLLSWSPLPIANNSFHQPASFAVLSFASPEGKRLSP
jgi:Carbohydrate family 9 binding domain-like